MVTVEAARKSNSALLSKSPLVAVIPGGTSGIGEYTLRALAHTVGQSTQGKGLRVYLIGRNTKAADAILADCQKECPQGIFTFIKAEDLSLLKDVDRCCDEITKAERQSEAKGEGKARVDFLIQSQFVWNFGPRQDTAEGLDKCMSLLYYSRMRFIQKLLPLLSASTLPSGATCVSVYAAGLEKPNDLQLNDLSLRKPENYGHAKVRSQVTFFTTFSFDRFAQQLEAKGNVRFIHVFPGLVVTPAFSTNEFPSWMKAIWWFAYPFAKLTSIGPEDIGQRMLYFLSDKYPAGGAAKGTYSIDAKGEANDLSKIYAGINYDEASAKAWQHTMKAFEKIEAGRTFTE